jgi:hypothetical protein
MNKNKKAKIISPLIVVPLSYLGAVLIHGAHPSVGDLLWSILFVAIISLPAPCVRIVVASNFQLEDIKNERKIQSII